MVPRRQRKPVDKEGESAWSLFSSSGRCCCCGFVAKVEKVEEEEEEDEEEEAAKRDSRGWEENGSDWAAFGRRKL